MRHAWLPIILALASVIPCESQTPQDDFPLNITIDSARDALLKLSANEEAEDARMGIAPPGLMMFRGAINGEHHWIFTCRKEVSGRESVPCTLIPIGEYRGRWVHDTSLLQIVGGPSEDPIIRFLMVRNEAKDPALPNDPVLLTQVYDFNVVLPNGKPLSNYPFLIHVYGSVSMEIPVGTRPGRTTCNESTWNPIQTTVNCTTLPPREIHHGYVTVDFSSVNRGMASMHCEAKWRWSSCSALEPGFYYARADDRKERLFVLTHDSNRKPKEIGFEVNMPADPATKSPIK
jgi:hypothetical protein